MKLIAAIAIFAAFFSASNAGSLLGSKRCTWGPSYWCRHVATMKECSSASYCAQLWRRSADVGAGADASPEECGFCKLLIGDLEKMLAANSTEAEIRSAADRACSLVPRPQLQSLCRAAIDAYLPQLLQLLRSELPPSRVCAALGICGAGPRDPALTAAPPSVRNEENEEKEETTTKTVDLSLSLPGNGSGLCDDCVKVLTSVKEAVEDNRTEAEIDQMLKAQVCSQLGPLRDACDSMVDQYLPEVLALLDKQIQPKQLCTLLGFCTQGKLAKYRSHPVMQLMLLQKSKTKPLSSVECELCEALVNEARELIRQKKTQQEVINFIETRVCSLVPAEKAQCTAAVQEYGPIIFQLLVSELDPQTVCQALGACGQASVRRQPPAAAAATPPSSRPTPLRAPAPAPRSVGIGPQCVLCEFVVRELDKMLGDNKSVAAIESALETVCSVLPQTLRSDCDSFVDEYTPVIVQLLTNELSPGLLCTVVGLCAGQRRQPPMPTLQRRRVDSATVCDVCQTVVVYAKSLLEENATEAEVTQVIEKVCSFLPTQEQAACRSFVEQYAPYVIQLLLQDVHPRQICQTLGLCQTQQQQGGARHAANGMVRMSRD